MAITTVPNPFENGDGSMPSGELTCGTFEEIDPRLFLDATRRQLLVENLNTYEWVESGEAPDITAIFDGKQVVLRMHDPIARLIEWTLVEIIATEGNSPTGKGSVRLFTFMQATTDEVLAWPVVAKVNWVDEYSLETLYAVRLLLSMPLPEA